MTILKDTVGVLLLIIGFLLQNIILPLAFITLLIVSINIWFEMITYFL